MTDASTPLPLSRATRQQWQEEAEKYACPMAFDSQGPCEHPDCEMARRILVLLSALQAQEQALKVSAGKNVRLRGALRELRGDANRLCDRGLGGTYEDDCRRSIALVDEVLGYAQEPTDA